MPTCRLWGHRGGRDMRGREPWRDPTAVREQPIRHDELLLDGPMRLVKTRVERRKEARAVLGGQA